MSDHARHVMDAILPLLPDADGAGDRRATPDGGVRADAQRLSPASGPESVGVRLIDGEPCYSAAFLDRHLYAVPDGRKENTMETAHPTTTKALLASVGRSQMPLGDALATLAENVADLPDARIHANVHELPLDFFARDDVANIRSNVRDGLCYLSATLDIGGHSFSVFSRHFPVEASE